MQPDILKETRRRKSAESIQSREPAGFDKEPVRRLSVSPRDEIQARIADRAHELYVERGYRQGHTLDDWLEAEREILGLECNA